MRVWCVDRGASRRKKSREEREEREIMRGKTQRRRDKAGGIKRERRHAVKKSGAV